MNKQKIMSGSELRIDVTLHNKRLLDLILENFPSVLNFCAEKNFHPTDIGLFINLKKSPIRKTTGEYRTTCQRLADLFLVDPEWLFPLELYRLEKTSLTLEMRTEHISFHECAQIPIEPMQDKIAEALELREKIDRVLSTLTPRQEKIVRMYFGLAGEVDCEESPTLIAQEFDVTPTRVQQILKKALRLLRHPSRSKKLGQFF